MAMTNFYASLQREAERANGVTTVSNTPAGDVVTSQSNSSEANPDINGGNTVSGRESDIVVTAEKVDERIRLSALNSTVATEVYGANDRTTNILSILHSTGGVLFPYTPTITVSQTVKWDPVSLVQANYDIHSYGGTPSVSLSVSGIFTAQNQQEGEYCAAVLHFLRTVSKSYFGNIDKAQGKAGLPPPVLRFRGYGDAMFNDVRCVLKSHSYTLDDSADGNLFVLSNGMTAKIPSKFTISMELGVQQTPAAQRDDFSLDLFRTGELLQKSKGWI